MRTYSTSHKTSLAGFVFSLNWCSRFLALLVLGVISSDFTTLVHDFNGLDTFPDFGDWARIALCRKGCNELNHFVFPDRNILTRYSTQAIYTQFPKLWGNKQLMWTESKSNKETFVYISDRLTFVLVVQNALPIVINRPMLF